ncbi:MAG: 50S ribosomal protein L25 [Nitrospirae bacterium]|nr:50S ribosomal protein L25 [Nitrospirota bacterium]
MAAFSLAVKSREGDGKRGARRVRREGFVPAVLYGPETAPITLSVPAHELSLLLKKGASYHTPIELKIEGNGASTKRVLIREARYHPVWGDLLHIDFYLIPTKRPLQVSIPLKLLGVPAGVADGGVMQCPTRRLLVLCSADRIPEVIEVDVSGVGKGHSLHASDVKLPEGVRCVERTDVTIVTVLMPKEEEKKPEEVAAAAPAEGAPAEGAAAAPAEGEAKAGAEAKPAATGKAAGKAAGKGPEKAPAKGAEKPAEKAAAKPAGKGKG